MEVIRRRLAFESDPAAFRSKYGQEQAELRLRIERARELLSQIEPSETLTAWTATVGIKLGVDGHRADITLMKTAMTLAAFQGRTDILPEDMAEAAMLVMLHRMRRRPFEEEAFDAESIRKLLEDLPLEAAHAS
jgi:Mg-chelatase subunit ChlI